MGAWGKEKAQKTPAEAELSHDDGFERCEATH
jgi:hypothetical protein